MKALNWLSHSVPGLLLCLVAGALAGTVAGPLGRFAWLVGQLYLSVVNMAAVPLLVVATFFGLRQVLALPRAGARFGAIIGTAAGVVGACALAGALAGVLTAPGAELSAQASEKLGALILSGVADGGEVRVDLHGKAGAEADTDKAPHALGDIIPDNFYRALAHGQTLGVLTGTLLFGLAFAALSREQTGMLSNVFEGIYRTFEQIIAHANLLIPVLAFGLAAHLSMHADRATMGAMAGVLVTFLMLCLLLSGVAAAAIAACARLPFSQVVTELNGSMLVGLASGSATAPIPHTIEAMSARLGFPRGLVELVVPLGAVFVRGGSALYFALVTVFVANLYGRPVGAGDVAWIAMAATIAAWLSAGQGGLGTIAYAGVALSVLQLPAEAAAVLLLAIDPICDGPRNALSLVCTCAVIALVSVGLPMERVAAQRMEGAEARAGVPGPRLPAAQAAAVRLVLTRAQLALASACALLAALLIMLMGIGVGAK
ncbi:MAG: dicarboxylate/amino acid:cation symporter [Cupriavidus necator]